MSLFQQSVVKKYLNDLDKDNLQQRWTTFTSHFHNVTIQQNILNAKEETKNKTLADAAIRMDAIF
jgi:hypothetical protein